MDQSSELEKLSQLMANGTISKREFNKKKQEILFPNKKKRRGLWWKLPLLGVVVIVILASLDRGKNSHPNNSASTSAPTSANPPAPVQQATADTSGQSDTPECVSDAAKANIEHIYAEQPDTTVRLKFLDWKDIKQISYNQKTKERKCQGYFIFNSESQEGRYDYRFYYATSTLDNFLIEAVPVSSATSDEVSGTTGN